MSSPAIEQKPGQHVVPAAILVMIVAGFFATTLAQPQVLGRLPLQNLLKSELNVSREAMASFFFWVGLPWYFKPFAGILTDAFPLLGTRRRWYFIASCGLAALSWIGLGLAPHQFTVLLWLGVIVNCFMVVASTVMGAAMVEAGQSYAATGRLTALRMFVQNVCTLLNGPLSGFLASGAFMIAAGGAAGIIAAAVPIAWLFMRERERAQANTAVLANARTQLKTIFTSRTLWTAAGFMFLLYVAPGFSTPLYYRQTDELKFSQQFIGNLGIFAGGAGLLSAAFYGYFCRKIPLRTMLYISVALAASGAVWYYFYNSQNAAILIESQNAFLFTLAELAVMDLAARATPKGCEGLGFSLLMSVRNLALFGTDILGSKLVDEYHMKFHQLVFLNAGSTAAVLLFIPFLPKILTSSRDDESPEARLAEETDVQMAPPVPRVEAP